MTGPLRGLGRGLGALIPPAPAESRPADGGVLLAPVDAISPNPRQPRTVMSADSLAELAASIREHGVIQPLIVTRGQPGGATYQLIAGERRWRAAQQAGLKMVPVLVKEANPQQVLELALVENIQRADLNALEEAAAYQALILEFGLSQGEVADRVGRSRTAVTNTLRLLRLPEPLKALLAGGQLSEGHARALLALPDDETMIRAAEQIVAQDLNVRQAEELTRRWLAPAERAEEEKEAEAPADERETAYTRRLEEDFRTALGTKVSLARGRRGGKLVIHFYSDEELQAIYDHIVSASERA